jgi:membrane protease YdiL (CAAX protease family)
MITNGKAPRDGLVDSLALYAVLFLPSLGFGSLPAPDRISWHFGVWAVSLPQVFLFYWGLRRRKDLESRGWSLSGASLAPRAFFLALAAGACAAIVAGLFALPTLIGPGAVPALPAMPLSAPPWGMLPLAALSALSIGYREECFFRAWLQADLEAALVPGPRGAFAAILLSSLLFAILHAYEGPAGICAAFAVSLLLAWRYSRRKDIHEVALAHALYDFAVLFAAAVRARS